MSERSASLHVPVALSLVAALALAIVPLPDVVDPLRPDWVVLVMIYWALTLPRTYGIGTAWIVGLVVDVTQGTLLGQHALALTVIVYLTQRFHLLMRVFPLLQLTATVFALVALYRFLLFWVNGVVGVPAPAIVYWGPVLTSALVWPIVLNVMAGVRSGAQS